MHPVSYAPGGAGGRKGRSELGPKKTLCGVRDEKRRPHPPCEKSNHPCHHSYGRPRVPIAEQRADRKYKYGRRRISPPIT